VGVAAVLAIGIPTAQALDFNLIYIVQQLISGQFSFSSNIKMPDTVSTARFQKILNEENIPVSLKKLWLPENFFVSEGAQREYLDFDLFQLKLLSDEKEWLLIDIIRYKNDTFNRQTETIDSTAEIYDTESRRFYILSNEKNLSAACFENNIEITVYGDIEKSELLKILDSIG